MRIAYVCRALNEPGCGAAVRRRAEAAVRAGHDVVLLGEKPPIGRASPTWRAVARPREGHRYLTDGHAYADRVYDALRALHAEEPFDVLEFVDVGGEALTVLRARRMLGAFAGTRIVVVPQPSAARPAPDSVEGAIGRFAEDYCRAHADGPAVPAPRKPVDDLVSVVIPVYDQGAYLSAAVESARHCGYPHVEVVVVDDGSTDPATLRVLDEIAGLPGVHLVRQANRGLPAARNAGIAAAAGGTVVPLDADDLLAADFLGPAVAALSAYPDLGCVGGYVRNFGLLDVVAVPLGYVPDLSLVVNTFPRATAAFRRDAVRAVGGYDESLPGYEDWDLYLRLHKAGYGIEVAPVVAQLYRRHAESMTFSRVNGMRVELTQALLRRHGDVLTDDGAQELLRTLVQLWKSGFEASSSVALQHGTPRRAGQAAAGRPATPAPDRRRETRAQR
jgi:hypothetical protein